MRKLILIVSAVFVFVLNASAQNRTVTGKVTDEKGTPLEGVSVTSPNGKQGTQTDKDGMYSNNVLETVSATIKNTGLSIVYTALVLIAGFIIFCFSGFGGTKALGWLTSATLLIATLTNLVLLPVLLLLFARKKVEIKKS